MTYMSGKGIWRSCFFLPKNKNTVAFLRRSNINRCWDVKESCNKYGKSYANLSKHSEHMKATLFLMRYPRLKKKKVTHPSLPSLMKAEMDNHIKVICSFQFPASLTSYLWRARRRGAWEWGCIDSFSLLNTHITQLTGKLRHSPKMWMPF